MTVAVDAEITALMLCLQTQRNHVLGSSGHDGVEWVGSGADEK
jgi:hypothetical protein